MFLLSTDYLEEASRYANDAVQNFQALEITSSDAIDASIIYGIAEIKLFQDESNINHLNNARAVWDKLSLSKNLPRNVRKHMDQLASELKKAE